jgi:uncharacterized protein affecting Mg2+/Co2+ transport
MTGCYYCISEDAHGFEVEIPSFELHQAHALH